MEEMKKWGPYKRTQTEALQGLPRKGRSRRGAAVDKGEKESLIYCGWSTAAPAVDELRQPKLAE